jgi:8-oxo-dGTP diphosphatase
MSQQPLGAFVIVINSENQVLLGERKNSYGVGLYGCPGGRLELSESLQDCAKRELVEETGLTAKSIKYLGVIREMQEGYNFIHFAFLCDEYEGQIELKEPDKCVSWNFYQLDSIPYQILPAHRAGLGYLSNPESNFTDILS